MRRFLFTPILPLLLSIASPVFAQESASMCEEPHAIDKYALLRRLSLDLRGTIPSVEEYDALDAAEDVSPATIQQYIESDLFRLQMRRYHETLFWPNLNSVKISVTTNTLTASKEPYALRLASTSRSLNYRKDADTLCGDFAADPAIFDPAFPGQFKIDRTKLTPDASGYYHEGWRLVKAYWDPSVTVKVCAFDAQETKQVVVNGKTLVCNTLEGRGREECGCGPGLAYCYGPGGVTDKAVKGSLREQLARAVDEVVMNHKPYTDLMLANEAWENGTIAFWKKNLAPSIGTPWTVPDPDDPLPAGDFLATDAWGKVARGSLHAGVLTTPGYLLRFQTNRGRANRFRINFMCEYFVPPDQLEPKPGCSEEENDLTMKCNCQYCHTTLEPLASHFGLFAEAGMTLMTDPLIFPKENAGCVKTSPSSFCRRFYVTQTDAVGPGKLLPYQYTVPDHHPEFVDNIEQGPQKLAQAVISDGTFASCTVKKTWGFLVKRDIQIDGSGLDETDVLTELAKGFTDNNYDLPWLVQEIVSRSQYRRAR
jgi:hypothetical protein